MCPLLPFFSCRKTMAVRWFARNTSAKSSSAWASKGRSAPHRSLRSLLTLLSTPSGYTKCSNFTPVWRGTDGVVWKSTPCMTLPRPAKRRGGFGPTNSNSSPACAAGEEWGKSPYGEWPFWDIVAEFVNFTERTEISDWSLDNPNGISSVLPLCKWKHPGC